MRDRSRECARQGDVSWMPGRKKVKGQDKTRQQEAESQLFPAATGLSCCTKNKCSKVSAKDHKGNHDEAEVGKCLLTFLAGVLDGFDQRRRDIADVFSKSRRRTDITESPIASAAAQDEEHLRPISIRSLYREGTRELQYESVGWNSRVGGREGMPCHRPGAFRNDCGRHCR